MNPKQLLFMKHHCWASNQAELSSVINKQDPLMAALFCHFKNTIWKGTNLHLITEQNNARQMCKLNRSHHLSKGPFILIPNIH